MSDVVVCNAKGCGHEFGSYPSGMEPGDQRTPCPECDGSSRLLKKAPVSATGTGLASVEYAARPPGRTSNRSRFAWGSTGWDYSKSLGRMVKKSSHFDKRGDRRFEHVEDPESGAVLHHEDHPLTEHRGHGSDKLKQSSSETPTHRDNDNV